MKQFSLILEVISGEHVGAVLTLSFKAKNAVIASTFTQRVIELKTFSGKPISFGAYELREHIFSSFKTWMQRNEIEHTEKTIEGKY